MLAVLYRVGSELNKAKQIGVAFGQRTDLWSDLPVEESFDLLRHTLPYSSFAVP